MTLGVVESATGGLISHLITNAANSSDYYKGSIVAYSNEAKIKV
ncbi:MAG: damage-inducible protein CinA, partial [Dehalococcoidales bacterium]|nr:damage-inducible protein CinA [Dehalococcoidales bacterium]